VTAGNGPPSVAATTVARLDGSSGWRRFAVRTDGPGWIALDRRLADRAALDAWVESELCATAGGHRDLAGALIVYRLAGHLAELTVGCLVDQRRALVLTPAAVALRFGDAVRLDEMAVSAPAVCVLPDDPDAGAAGTEVMASVGALRGVAANGMIATYGPVADAVRARAPFGLRGMWGTLADHVAEVAVRRAREQRRDVGAAWDEAERLLDDLAARVPSPWTRPRRQVVPTATGPQAVVTKGTCCLIYKAGADPGDRGAATGLIAPAACTSCPLRSEDDRARRFAAYLDSVPQRP
jgi:hypothetical protein